MTPLCRWFEGLRVVGIVVQNLNFSKVLQSRIVRERQSTIVVNWPKRGDMEITGMQAQKGGHARQDNGTQVSIVTWVLHYNTC